MIVGKSSTLTETSSPPLRSSSPSPGKDHCRFSVESKKFPALTSSLTGDRGGFYTQDDIRELVAYGQARGVAIVPEFDVPGHTRGMLPLEASGAEFCDPPAQVGLASSQRERASERAGEQASRSVSAFLSRALTSRTNITPGRPRLAAPRHPRHPLRPRGAHGRDGRALFRAADLRPRLRRDCCARTLHTELDLRARTLADREGPGQHGE